MDQDGEAAGWRPMRTAPKDGRRIVGVLCNGQMTVRLRWDGRRWANDLVRIDAPLEGWRPA